MVEELVRKQMQIQVLVLLEVGLVPQIWAQAQIPPAQAQVLLVAEPEHQAQTQVLPVAEAAPQGLVLVAEPVAQAQEQELVVPAVELALVQGAVQEQDLVQVAEPEQAVEVHNNR
jgi:hypothetical protein